MYKAKEENFRAGKVAAFKPVVDCINWYGSHTRLARYGLDTNALTRCLQLAANILTMRAQEAKGKKAHYLSKYLSPDAVIAKRIHRGIDLAASLKALVKSDFELLLGEHPPQTYREATFINATWRPVQNEFSTLQRDGKLIAEELKFYLIARAVTASFVEHLLQEYPRLPALHQPRDPYDRASIKTSADGRKYHLEFKSLN